MLITKVHKSKHKEKNMKHLAIVSIFAIFLMAGCSGMDLNVSDDSTSQVLGYATGKAMGVGFGVMVRNGTISQVTEDRLNELWDNMMTDNAGADPVPSETVMQFFNHSLFILTGEITDPYGLIQDLGVLLTIYGAQYDDAGNMIGLQPVPLKVMQMFAFGYDNGYKVGYEQ